MEPGLSNSPNTWSSCCVTYIRRGECTISLLFNKHDVLRVSEDPLEGESHLPPLHCQIGYSHRTTCLCSKWPSLPTDYSFRSIGVCHCDVLAITGLVEWHKQSTPLALLWGSQTQGKAFMLFHPLKMWWPEPGLQNNIFPYNQTTLSIIVYRMSAEIGVGERLGWNGG